MIELYVLYGEFLGQPMVPQAFPTLLQCAASLEILNSSDLNAFNFECVKATLETGSK